MATKLRSCILFPIIFSLIGYVVISMISWASMSRDPIGAQPQSSVLSKRHKVEFSINKCEQGPAKNILYLKIYKTGSSTLQNIFYRYAWNNGLSIVPVYSDPHLHDINSHLVPKQYRNKGPYNIYPEHIKNFNTTDYTGYLYNDTIYVSALRYPFTQFVSLIKELDYMPEKIGLKNTEPEKVVKELLASNEPRYLHPLLGHPDLLYNTMSTQFNLMNADGTEKNNVDRLLDDADDIFSLVMLTEYFNEGLVLLRRKLCWDQKDIIYIPLRQRPDIADHISFDGYMEEHKKRSATDYKLYEHFKSKMLRIIASQGEDFHQELTNFKQRNRGIGIFCNNIYNTYRTRHSIVNDRKPSYQMEANAWTSGFSVSPYQCLIMKTENHVFRNMLLFRQMPIMMNICKQKLPDMNIDVNLGLTKGKKKKLYFSKYYCKNRKPKTLKELFAGHLGQNCLSL